MNWLSLILFLSGAVKAGAQTISPAKAITGFVRDGEQKSIEGATVRLQATGDSLFQKNVLTDRSGSFTITGLRAGSYRLLVTAVGYAPLDSTKVRIDESDTTLQLPMQIMRREPSALGQVTIVGRRPLIEQKAGRLVINVEASVTNTGATALEVLEKSPGVSVDKDGNISLKGKQGVLVLLDGKPTYLSGADLAALLESMSANQLDQIEIMTNPPAQYEAAGNAGVINIKTKKTKARGLNGSLTGGLGQGRYGKTNNSLNLNYRTNRFNFFLNAGVNIVGGYTDLHLLRRYLDADGKTVSAIFDEPTYLRRKTSGNTAKLGMDYFLNSKTTLGIVTTGLLSTRHTTGTSSGYLQDPTGHTDSVTYTGSTNDNRILNGTVNLNIRHSFDTLREITADADYIQYNNTNPQLYINSTYDANAMLTNGNQLRGDLPSLIHIWSVKADYSQTLRPGWKAMAGWKSSLVKTDNTANYYDLAGSSWEPDYGKTNHFLYRENINAAYLTLNHETTKWTLQTGLRFENTYYDGRQLGNPQKPDSSFNRQYNDLFPTLFLSYKPSAAHQYTLTGGRRIDRPAYQSLNPFLFFINQFTYEVGNPFLQPQYTENIEASHLFRGWLTTSLSYSDTRSYFTEIFHTTGDTTIFTHGNLGRQQNTILSFNVQLTMNPWWSLTVHGDLGYKIVDGFANSYKIHTEGVNGRFDVSNQFRWKGGWSAELSGFYTTKDVEGQFVSYPFGQVSAGVAKTVLRGRGTIRVNEQDVLFTNYLSADIIYQNVREHFVEKKDTRAINLSFTYRFGKTLKDADRGTRGGATDEQNRVRF